MGNYDVVYMSNVLNSKPRIHKDNIEEQRSNGIRVNSEGFDDAEENQQPTLRTVEEKRKVRFCNRSIEQK